jgi:diacylglycerol kinase family enzyme
MYYYIYDTFLNNAKYAKSKQRIEARLADLGIAGKRVQLSLLKSMREIIRTQFDAGVRNFVAVGDDATFLNVINAAAEFDVTIGYIPVGQAGQLAEMLGILPDDAACDILSARIVERVDLGKINHYHFLTNVKFLTGTCELQCEEASYTVQADSRQSRIEVINLNTHIMLPDFVGDIDARDGVLNIVVQSPAEPERKLRKLFKKSQHSLSFFSIKQAQIKTGKDVKALVDGIHTVKMPLEITLAARQMPLIVGKTRTVLL